MSECDDKGEATITFPGGSVRAKGYRLLDIVGLLVVIALVAIYFKIDSDHGKVRAAVIARETMQERMWTKIIEGQIANTVAINRLSNEIAYGTCINSQPEQVRNIEYNRDNSNCMRIVRQRSQGG